MESRHQLKLWRQEFPFSFVEISKIEIPDVTVEVINFTDLWKCFNNFFSWTILPVNKTEKFLEHQFDCTKGERVFFSNNIIFPFRYRDSCYSFGGLFTTNKWKLNFVQICIISLLCTVECIQHWKLYGYVTLRQWREKKLLKHFHKSVKFITSTVASGISIFEISTNELYMPPLSHS